MKLIDAKAIAEDVCYLLMDHFTEWKICGSIRRAKAEIKDIDIVAVQKTNYSFGEKSLEDDIAKLDPEGKKLVEEKKEKAVTRFLNGDDIKRFKYRGIVIDLYLAKPDTYSCLVLIRTGSTNHNIKLTTSAKSMGLKLFASGQGLCKIAMENGKEVIVEKVATGENEILMKLLGRIPTPQEREYM